MTRSAFAIALCLALAAVSPSLAAQLPARFATADGAWDCKDEVGTSTGTVVVAETTYAFIKTDGKLGGYGKLNLIQTDDGLDLPTFVVTDGYLKDELSAVGLHMRGPIDDPWRLTGELYLNGVFGTDGKHYWDCVRRKAPQRAPVIPGNSTGRDPCPDTLPRSQYA